MFNSPRPSQRYVGTTSNGLGGSFVDTNPLSNSVYDEGLDPWSSAPSPVPTPIPQAPASVFSAVIGDYFVDTTVHLKLNASQRTQQFLLSIIEPITQSTLRVLEKPQ